MDGKMDIDQQKIQQADSVKGLESSGFKKRLNLSRWGQSRRPVATVAVVTIMVLVLVVVGAVLLQDVSLGGKKQRIRSVYLQDIIEGKFQPNSFNGTWVSDYEFLYKGKGNNPILYNLNNYHSDVLIRDRYMIPIDDDTEYYLTGDHRFLLVKHNITRFMRHTSLAQYEVINIKEQTEYPLRRLRSGEDGHLLQAVVSIPRSSGLVYVYRNNIYFRPTAANPTVEYELTNTGIPGLIYNGVTDLTYCEFAFKSETALWLSPNGKKIAFVTFNDTLVSNMSVPWYEEPGIRWNRYPLSFDMHYPKAGSKHPEITLSVLNLEAKLQNQLSTKKVTLPWEMKRLDPILHSVAWINNDELASVWLSRMQEKAVIYKYNYEEHRTTEIISVRESKGWLTINSPPIFSWRRASKMLFVVPQEEAGFGELPHIIIVHYPPIDYGFKRLTRGNFEVTKIVSWDEMRHIIYFIGRTGTYPQTQHLYSVSDSVDGAPHNAFCITCSMKTVYTNVNCMHNDASFSHNATYFMVNCAGPDVPEISINKHDGTHMFLWDNNQHIQVALSEVLDVPKTMHLQIDLLYGFKAQVKLFLPPDYTTKKSEKYPLIVHVDGAPNTCMVTNEFSINWDTYLSGNKNYVVAYIDGRGSGAKGSDILFELYKNLGSREVIDQIYIAKYLQEHYKFIDRKRTAIWGRNYGGYVSALALMKDNENVFQCGISVSPITEWIYYDSIYTERYMGLLTEDSLPHYIDSGLTNKVENLRHKKFLLIHGTFDSVVHYQQSMVLAKVLEQRDILFRQQTYPDEDNSFSRVQGHFYHTMENFFQECFKYNP